MKGRLHVYTFSTHDPETHGLEDFEFVEMFKLFSRLYFQDLMQLYYQCALKCAT